MNENIAMVRANVTLLEKEHGKFKKEIADVTAKVKAAIQAGIHQKLGLQKRVLGVENCRTITKKDLIHNGATPKIEVDPETYKVKVDGELITCAPASELPLAQRYFLF